MLLVDAEVHSEHVQIIRCDIERNRSRNAESLKMSQF
jgi:hypothetical protein